MIQYIAAQVAGSCRLEGIHVSQEDEAVMTAIIVGDIDASELRQQRVDAYRKKHSATLKAANCQV